MTGPVSLVESTVVLKFALSSDLQFCIHKKLTIMLISKRNFSVFTEIFILIVNLLIRVLFILCTYVYFWASFSMYVCSVLPCKTLDFNSQAQKYF